MLYNTHASLFSYILAPTKADQPTQAVAKGITIWQRQWCSRWRCDLSVITYQRYNSSGRTVGVRLASTALTNAGRFWGWCLGWMEFGKYVMSLLIDALVIFPNLYSKDDREIVKFLPFYSHFFLSLFHFSRMGDWGTGQEIVGGNGNPSWNTYFSCIIAATGADKRPSLDCVHPTCTSAAWEKGELQ